MKCPLCGSRVTFAGLTSVECTNSACLNGPAPAVVSPIDREWGDYCRHYEVVETVTQRSGSRWSEHSQQHLPWSTVDCVLLSGHTWYAGIEDVTCSNLRLWGVDLSNKCLLVRSQPFLYAGVYSWSVAVVLA
jgi:hypothetical protein